MRFLPSANRHGVSVDEIRHALAHPVRWFDGDDFVMLIGAGVDGRLVEVGVRTADDGETVVFHAMPARAKYLR